MRALAATLVALLLLFSTRTAAAETSSVDIRISPSVQVKGEDSYVCVTRALPDKPLKLVGVEPLAQQEVVHHILLFGCDEPYAKPKDGEQAVWECKSQPTCGGLQEAILYGWGRNAPKLELPKGVGFSIGRGSAVKWVVMQLHYLKEKPAGDQSGVKLRVQDTPVPFSAGMLSYASWFTIPPKKKQHFVLNHCCYRGFQPLNTFAVRVHTHTMGRQVFMTRTPAANTAGAAGEVIAVGDPLKPQGFSPAKAKTLWPGERFTVGCEFDSSDKTAPVSAGADHTHEMCNMYLMVYSSIPHIEMCSDGVGIVDEASPGNIPRHAALQPDPFPGWKPPAPQDTFDEKIVGHITSVAMGPDGNVWILTRGGRSWETDSFTADNKLIETSPIDADLVMQLHPDTGKVLRRWGAGHFHMPHMLTVDRNNTVWVTDVGRHQVLQFSADGKLLRTVGKLMEPGHDKHTLCKPTQVAFLNDGSFLVADGYCNSRVVRYNADASYASQYELPIKGAAQGGGGSGMTVAHSVVLDECDGFVAVADREGRAVHKFDLHTHKLLETKSLTQYGKPWALLQGPYGRTLALCWEAGKDATVVDLYSPNSVRWALPNSTALWPHDFALGAGALPLTGAGDRLLALYVAPLCKECGPLHKYVMVPQGFDASHAAAAQPAQEPGKKVRPPLAHLGGHGHAAKAATAAAAAAAAAAATAGDAPEVVSSQQVVEPQGVEQLEGAAAAAAGTAAGGDDSATQLQELKAELAELQRKVAKVAGSSSGTGQEEDAQEQEGQEVQQVVRSAGGSSGSSSSSAGGPKSWGSYVATVSLSVALGVLLGGLALLALQRRLSPPQQQHKRPGHAGGGAAANGTGAGVRYSPTRSSFNISDRLAEDEAEGEALAASDTRRLLNGNGHLSSALQR